MSLSCGFCGRCVCEVIWVVLLGVVIVVVWVVIWVVSGDYVMGDDW